MPSILKPSFVLILTSALLMPLSANAGLFGLLGKLAAHGADDAAESAARHADDIAGAAHHADDLHASGVATPPTVIQGEAFPADSGSHIGTEVVKTGVEECLQGCVEDEEEGQTPHE